MTALRKFSMVISVTISCMTEIFPGDSRMPKIQEPPEHHFSWFKVIPESGLNVRNRPATDGKILYTLPQDHTGRVWARTKAVEVIDNRPGYWFRIGENEKVGWIFSGYTYTGESYPGGYWEVWDESFHAFSQLPAFKSTNLGKKILSARTLNGEISLFEIKGAPVPEGHCGVAPRIAEIRNTIESKTYQYMPLQNPNGIYVTDLNQITEVLPGILAISEFNGQCNGRTRTWPRLILFGKNGAFTVVQDLEDTTPYCGEGGENTLRRVQIEKDSRRILVFERQGECVDRGRDQSNSGSYEATNYGPPKYIVISIENSVASSIEYSRKSLPVELRKIFTKLEKKSP